MPAIAPFEAHLRRIRDTWHAGLVLPPFIWSRHRIASDDIELTIPRQVPLQAGLSYVLPAAAITG